MRGRTGLHRLLLFPTRILVLSSNSRRKESAPGRKILLGLQGPAGRQISGRGAAMGKQHFEFSGERKASVMGKMYRHVRARSQAVWQADAGKAAWHRLFLACSWRSAAPCDGPMTADDTSRCLEPGETPLSHDSS